MQWNNLFNKIQVSRWLWSALYFAITFILLNYTSHFWSSINAWQIGFNPSFSYNGMDRILPSAGWSAKRIAFVYLAPPLWGLFSSAVGYIGFSKTSGLKTHLRTFFFWHSFNGFLLYFSYLITGILSGVDYASDFFTGFAGFYTWLEWPKSTIIGIIVFQIITGLALSLIFPPLILKLNHSRKINLQRSGKWIVLVNVFLIPTLLGSMLVLLQRSRAHVPERSGQRARVRGGRGGVSGQPAPDRARHRVPQQLRGRRRRVVGRGFIFFKSESPCTLCGAV